MFGLVVAVFPVLRFVGVVPGDGSLALIASIPMGLTQGFFGLMVLGFLCDGSRGYRPLWLITSMMLIGALWITVYPNGWMLGVPFVVYAAEKLLRAARNRRAGTTRAVQATDHRRCDL